MNKQNKNINDPNNNVEKHNVKNLINPTMHLNNPFINLYSL